MNRLAWRLETRPVSDPLGEWLCSDFVVGPGGHVVSWVNPDHPGFLYPEASALWLSWAVWRRRTGRARPPDARVGQVCSRLMADLAPRGAVGRDGAVYLFDTCVTVDALARAGAWRDRGVPDTLWTALEAFLGEMRPVLPCPDGKQARWSTSYGPHMVKAAALLARAAGTLGEPRFVGVAGRVLARVIPVRTDAPAYCHALAYAAEGALLLRVLGHQEGPVSPEEAAERLASLQGSDGAIPAWSDGSGPARADATAQAARLWVATDPRRYRAAIETAVAFLQGSRAPDGGI